jgi:hypothetical protein
MKKPGTISLSTYRVHNKISVAIKYKSPIKRYEEEN